MVNRMEAAPRHDRGTTLAIATGIIQQEAEAVSRLADRLGGKLTEEFDRAVHSLLHCQGATIVTGMGKAGLIGQKISATLCSTGTRSFFLHPAEAIHGDLGRVSADDVVLALSMSGETEELMRVIPSLRDLARTVISITAHRDSSLAHQSHVTLDLGKLDEACANGLAPSTSTTAMVALGDALALTVSQLRGFQEADFAKFHPGGSLGRKLTKVTDAMRTLEECRVAVENSTVQDSFVTLQSTGRRTGAVMIVDDCGKLVGLFTDSDLAKLLHDGAEGLMQRSVGDVMTKDPISLDSNALMPVAVRLLADHQISELPIVDDVGRPIGMIDITDVISWLPPRPAEPHAPTLLPFPRS